MFCSAASAAASSWALGQMLEHMGQLGLHPLLLVCDEAYAASALTIEPGFLRVVGCYLRLKRSKLAAYEVAEVLAGLGEQFH